MLIDKGDYRAIELWIKYAYGTPKQTVDITHNGDVDLNVTLKNLVNFSDD